MIDLPVLIIGQGLAGTALAWRLHRHGVRFVVVDPGVPDTCSKIAAGLVTPITGRRVKQSWRIGEFLPDAMSFYSDIETQLGARLFHRVPLVRLFNEQREVEWWRGRQGDAGLSQWVDPDEALVSSEDFHSEFGGFVQRHSGWLDTASYLSLSRAYFSSLGALVEASVDEEEIAQEPGGVSWRGAAFSAVVFCRGSDERCRSRFFSWLRFDCARGVIASMRAQLSEGRMVNRGAWIIPRTDGLWKAGSTYEFDLKTPMEASVSDLTNKLARLLRVPFELGDARAGIRPIIKHRFLVLGRHPSHPQVLVFNGLGSKGVLRAPFFAEMLAKHLLAGDSLEPEVDVQSND